MATVLAGVRRISLGDLDETEQVLERTPIPGLYWIRTYFLRTSDQSRIILPLPGQGNFTAVYHSQDFSAASHGGYDVYGIHLGQVDVLTFLAADDRTMIGHFVDCRRASQTLHEDLRIEFKGNPDRALVIERGIAHIFDNLLGMVTLNQPILYFDYTNPDFDPNIDVVNVPRDTASKLFPVLSTNRFRMSSWMCRLALKWQRIQLRKGFQDYHPFRFKAAGKTVTVVPKGLPK
jgi:hypothetical protein